MAATFADLDAVIAALPGQHARLGKNGFTAEGNGTWFSLWKVAGNPSAGATPPTGDGEIPTKATAGAVPFTNAAGGNKLHLGKAAVSAGSVGTLVVYDRLWHNSGFVGNTASAQTISTPPTLTRPDANGAGVEIWMEVYSAMGASAATFTVTYTNQGGTGSRSATYSMPANALTVGQIVPFAFDSGDTGARTVSQVQLSGSTGTAGDFGLVLLRRLAEIPVKVAGSGELLDALDLALVDVDNDACLAFMWFANSTSVNPVQASFSLIES